MSRKEHTYSVGDRVMVRDDPQGKHGEKQYLGPFTVDRVYDNGTLRLAKATTAGAVYQTWNIRTSTKWFRRIESGADVSVRCGLKLSVGGGSSPVSTPQCAAGLIFQRW